MTTMFGKGLRGRRKAADADGETAQIADEANLWWTRRDFVQHAVVRTSRNGEPVTPTAPRRPEPAREAPPAADPHLEGRTFSEVFTTESLFQGTEDALRTPPTARTPRPPSAVRRPATGRAAGAAAPRPADTPPRTDVHAPADVAPPPAPEPEPAPRRPRLPANHPLIGALEVLGLDGDAAWADIQHAYRARAKTAHPDRTGDDGEAMAALNAAYTSLRDGRRYGIFGDD